MLTLMKGDKGIDFAKNQMNLFLFSFCREFS